MAKPPATDPRRWKNADPQEIQRIYETARQSLVRKFTDPQQRQKALARFDSDPRMQALRKKAGLAPVTTKQQELKSAAKTSKVSKPKNILQQINDFVPEQILAVGSGINQLLPGGGFNAPASAIGALMGAGGEGDFSDRYTRLNDAATSSDWNRIFENPVSGAVGVAGGLYLGGRGSSAAASRAPEGLRRLLTLQRGQTGRNALKVVGAGAVGGSADAAIRSAGDLGRTTEGALYGAGGAAAVGSAIKVGTSIYKGLRNLAGFEPVEEVLTKYVKTPVAEIERSIEERAKLGLPSSIYEVLPSADRQALDDAIGKMEGRSRDRLVSAVKTRTENMVQETAGRVKGITRPRMQQAQNKLASDLAASRGAGTPLAAEERLAQRASRSLMDMETLAAVEARNIMRPYDAKEVFESVNSLVPQHPVQRGATIEMVEDSPEIGAMIRRSAGLLRSKNTPITVKDVTDILSRLRRRANGEEGDIAREAIDYITDTLEREHPDIAAAVGRMRNQWHTRLSAMEGMLEGARGRLRENVPATRQARNAYETAGGRTGRVMGQSAQLERDLLVSPDASLRAMNEIAANPTLQAGISQNLGRGAGEGIAEVARAQTQAAQRLGRLTREQDGDPQMGGGQILQNLMMLSPNTLPVTKALAMSRLVSGSLRIPEKQGSAIVDMLFSQNPAQIAKAMKTLENYGVEGKQFIRSIGRDLQTGALSAPDSAAPVEMDDPYAEFSDPVEMDDPYAEFSDPVEMDDPYAEFSDPVEMDDPYAEFSDPVEDQSSPYSQDLDALYDSEDPALLDLIERVSRQESGGNQFGSNGQPLTSSAGAIGVMQVMPDTAPEAARYAGLPWDPDAYKNDEVYNKLIGTAYLSEMLRRYDGDVELALVAYNAGPKRADAYSKGKISFSGLPEETQKYVRRILQ